MELADFFGTWQLSREIRQADGTQGYFDGEAVWWPDGPGALYVEKGKLSLPQGTFRSERRYRWDVQLNVFFEDGRYFHAVPEDGGAAAHWCDPDQYDVTYDFATWPDWACHWRVTGPRKDYRMVSHYARG